METANKLQTRTLLSALGGILLLSASFFFFGNARQEKVAETLPKTAPSVFETLTLEAKAAYVMDLQTGDVLYEKNPELQLPLASLTKLMLAAVASDTSGDTPITITREALRADGDSGLKRGETWTLSKLLSFTLLTSSNDGATAIAGALGALAPRDAGKGSEEAFVEEMNKKAQTLGLAQTYFLNPTGLDVTTEMSGAYGSAKDVALLMSAVLKANPALLTATQEPTLKFRSLDNALHTGNNTDPLVDHVPGVVASKTGYTDIAGGNLAFAFDVGLGHPVVAVVLGSSYDGRFTDIEKLVIATRKAVAPLL